MSRFLLLAFASLAFAASAWGQFVPGVTGPEESRRALAAAIEARKAAEQRGRQLQEQADRAGDAADRSASQAAALAARIQEAEAGIIAANLRIAMIEGERDTLSAQLGVQQKPLVELTAALQQFTRRPVALSLLQPGSVKDVVYLRAVLHDTVPAVQRRTQGLRAQLARSRELRREAGAAAEVLAAEEQALSERRTQLATSAARQKLAAREAGLSAEREAAKALALSEDTRDLDSLVGELDRAAALRQRLAQLPGPSLRPARPGDASMAGGVRESTSPSSAAGAAPSPYILPVTAPVVTGFGSPIAGGLSKGLMFAPVARAQIVAPAPGRVAFAGAYRGYGLIVIIAHDGGWTSLVTGLGEVDVEVGDELVGGAPLGSAAAQQPSIALELRWDGTPVNPLSIAG